MMHAELRGLTASFRVPHMFKYHRSLPLPPYTAVVGMFGAALGKDMSTAQEIFERLELKVGMAGGYAGGCNDTWRVLTTQTSENDVIERQILYKPQYHIIFYGSLSSIRICEQVFRCPVYPLSLGRPEDLANVIVHDVIEREPEDLPSLKNTVVVGIPSAQIEETLFDIDDPADHGPCISLYRLPIHYHFESGFAYERMADKFRDFTFIGNHKIIVKPTNDFNTPKGFTIKTSKKENEEFINIPLLEI